MKKIDKKQLKIVSMEFRSIANRVMNCNRDTGMSLLKKLLAYIDNSEIISEYIRGYLSPDDFQEVESGTTFKSMGATEQEEVSRTYQYLKYATSNFEYFDYDIASGYARNIDDSIKEFCYRIILPFVNYIETYLVQIGIKMGYDEDVKYTITVSGGTAQVNIADNGSDIDATQNNSMDITHLNALINSILNNIPKSLDNETKEQIRDSLDVIKEEAQSNKPQGKVIRTAMAVLRGINSTTQFAASVAALVQFVGSINFT